MSASSSKMDDAETAAAVVRDLDHSVARVKRALRAYEESDQRVLCFEDSLCKARAANHTVGRELNAAFLMRRSILSCLARDYAVCSTAYVGYNHLPRSEGVMDYYSCRDRRGDVFKHFCSAEFQCVCPVLLQEEKERGRDGTKDYLAWQAAGEWVISFDRGAGLCHRQ